MIHLLCVASCAHHSAECLLHLTTGKLPRGYKHKEMHLLPSDQFHNKYERGSKLWKIGSRGTENVSANFEVMRNPLYLTLAELHNLKTELIASCVYVLAITHKTVKETQALLCQWCEKRSWFPMSEFMKVTFGFIIWASTVIIISNLIFYTFSQCNPSSLNCAAKVSAENKPKINTFGIEIRWNKALQRANNHQH